MSSATRCFISDVEEAALGWRPKSLGHAIRNGTQEN